MSALDYSDALLRSILTQTKVVACVGISKKEIRPSNVVARNLASRGFRVIPINPAYAGEELLGETVYASLTDIPADITVDMVDIFRRSDQVEPIVDEAIEALLPRGLTTIWMQIGVINAAAADKATKAGLVVIMDRCPKIEYQRLFGEQHKSDLTPEIISPKQGEI